jgi:glycosyltransferase involved in cell wall biosynthesis
MPYISVVTPTYNEEENIVELCNAVQKVFNEVGYDYEHIIIDNSSKDNTVSKVKDLIIHNSSIKIIVNSKNYGHLLSPFYGIKQSSGDATILINADFQDPPELIKKLIESWEDGNKITLLQKIKSDEPFIIKYTRKFYYWFLTKTSSTNLTQNTTGSGIIDKSIVKLLKKIEDPMPYLRGLLAEIGPEISLVKFEQPARKKGESKNNFFSLFDLAMIGLIKQSKFFLRFMTICGLTISILSFLISIIFLALKLFFWDQFEMGKAPLLIGLFAISGFQILFLGLLGEYLSVVLSHIRKLPGIIEKERFNFKKE